MFDEVFDVIGDVVDKLANTEEGHKMTDNLGLCIGRLYKNLVEVQGLPPEAAASICASIGRSSGK